MKTSLVAFVLASFLAACAGTHMAPRDPLPATFQPSQIAAAAEASYRANLADSDRQRGSPKMTRFHILAWQRTDTLNPHVDPFQYSRSCIVWSEFRYSDGTERWRVAHLVPGRRGWEEQLVSDAPIPGSRTFARRPTNEDILKFLNDTEWMSQLSAGTIEAGICKRAWLAATNVPPPVVLSFAERPKGRVLYY